MKHLQQYREFQNWQLASECAGQGSKGDLGKLIILQVGLLAGKVDPSIVFGGETCSMTQPTVRTVCTASSSAVDMCSLDSTVPFHLVSTNTSPLSSS